MVLCYPLVCSVLIVSTNPPSPTASTQQGRYSISLHHFQKKYINTEAILHQLNRTEGRQRTTEKLSSHIHLLTLNQVFSAEQRQMNDCFASLYRLDCNVSHLSTSHFTCSSLISALTNWLTIESESSASRSRKAVRTSSSFRMSLTFSPRPRWKNHKQKLKM